MCWKHLKVARSNAYFPETHIHLLWKLFQAIRWNFMVKGQPVEMRRSGFVDQKTNWFASWTTQTLVEWNSLFTWGFGSFPSGWRTIYMKDLSTCNHFGIQHALFGTTPGTIAATCHQHRTWRWSPPSNTSVAFGRKRTQCPKILVKI